MADQDAQDINQMMSATAENVVQPPKKSKFVWIVLGCVVLGVGLGVVVYQQSLTPPPRPTPTPRPSTLATPVPTVTPVPQAPIPSPVTPDVSVVSPVTNTLTFPKAGKLRIYHNLSGIQQVLRVTVAGSAKTITMPVKTTTTAVPMNFADATFDVTAGSVGTIELFLNSTSGPKMRGWVNANNQTKCGVNGAVVIDMESQLDFVQTKLGGESIFSYQCWEDDDTPGEFNDVYMLWTYVPSATAASPSPSASVAVSPSPSPSASVVASIKPSSSPSTSPSPSPSPIASPRVTMPDTDDGVPVTGVFEVTMGTVSIGLLLLVLGLFGLLML